MYQMHVVHEPRRKVFLVRYTGEVYAYDSYREFLSYLRSDIIGGIWTSFRAVRYTYNVWWSASLGRSVEEKIPIYTIWVAHWDHKSGPIVNPEQLKEDWKEYCNENRRRHGRYRSWWYHRNNRVFEFRCDPVPFIHKYHSHKGTYYRHMKTTQERRWSLAEKDDGVRWRARRNFHNLPNAWDDWARHNEKNWKRFRKHQWK